MAKREKLENQYDFVGLPIDELITKPLVSIVRAQNKMAREQVRGLLKDCFNFDGHHYNPKMLKMKLIRAVIEPGKNNNEPPVIKHIVAYFNLPLITIFPISSLGIESVNIDFEMEITSQYSIDIDSNSDNEESSNENISMIPSSKMNSKIEMLGKIAPKSNITTNNDLNVNVSESLSQSATYSIDVVAGPLPLTKGILAILDVYTKAIEPVEMPKEEF